MIKFNGYKITLVISIILFMLSLICGMIFFGEKSVYIESNSIIYHVNEDDQITSIEITVSNATLQTIEGEDLIIRYCREDRYPEGYTSPIILTLKPFESRTIKIDNFRNTWYYNEDYHIESDRIDLQNNTPMDMKDGFCFKELFFIFAIGVPISLLSIIICAINIQQTKKIQEDK